MLRQSGPKKSSAPVLGRTTAAQNPPQDPPPKLGPAAPLLAEADLTTQEQRKADWGIIKEMSRYLWPKVGASFSPL